MTRSSRRQVLDGVKPGQAQHAGLWWQHYLQEQLERNESVGSKQQTPQQSLVEQVGTLPVPDIYRDYYIRWKETCERMPGAEIREMPATGRLAVGLGEESVVETGITLHHTYGVPLIPGSALKGMAAAFARQQLEDPRWQKDGDAYHVVFGATDSAGFVTFFDALYVPGSGPGGQPLHPDVLTVHHKDYYEGKGAPADWDSPTPVPFLSAAGSYLVVLECAFPAWRQAALDIVEQALASAGVGAKTSSGYGRLGEQRKGETAPPEVVTGTLGTAPPGYERGKVKDFGLGKNQSFGFIIPDGGGAEIFVHRKQLHPGLTTLYPGQYVYYRREQGEKGPMAVDVHLLE